MKLTFEQLLEKIKALGLIDDKGAVISFAAFKKLANIDQYGHGKHRVFIIYVRNSRENILAFYPRTNTRPLMLKTSYDFLINTLTTDTKFDYEYNNICWGNCGIPLAYGKLRIQEENLENLK